MDHTLENLRSSIESLRRVNVSLYPGHGDFFRFRLKEKISEREIQVSWNDSSSFSCCFLLCLHKYISVKVFFSGAGTREELRVQSFARNGARSNVAMENRNCYPTDPDVGVSAGKKHPGPDSDTGESISPETSSGLSLRNVDGCSDSHRCPSGLELSTWRSGGGRRWLRWTCLHGKVRFFPSVIFRSFCQANSFFQKNSFFLENGGVGKSTMESRRKGLRCGSRLPKPAGAR